MKLKKFLPQLLTLLFIVLVFGFFTMNAQENMGTRGIEFGFGFLTQEASFDIQFSLIDYDGSHSYARAYLVGLLNTLLVAFIGIILATILGIIVGVARLSPNYLIRKTSSFYIEFFRNVPLLLQIFFWYFAALRALPMPQDATMILGSSFMTIKGLYTPAPIWTNFDVFLTTLVAALFLVFFFVKFAKKKQEQEGKQLPVLIISLLIFIGLPLLTFLVGGVDLSFSFPELRKMSQSSYTFDGGMGIPPELIALTLALTLYTATTRPETMLGDTAIAVNPKDERFKDFIGKVVTIPIVGRKIKIIEDDYADPEQGTGALKITPAHDFNDYDVGQRNNLEIINIFTEAGKINENAPKEYIGLDRFEARKRILKELKEKEFFVKEENIKNKVPYGDRSNSIIEPFLTEQWFVDAEKLSVKAKEVVSSKKTNFFPENWSKTYFQWMNNIEPWCISRQLWWGHQIPAWYSPDKKIFVAYNEEEAKKLAYNHYGKDVELIRDADVLDTWFSSGLWPFATLGWPEDKNYVEKFYPTSVLVTGFDIIFFWVARMIMFGTEFLNKEPFKDIYVHALVRDEKGQKMSKSKGNVIDPLDLIEKYSADALRFTLLSMASPGTDVKLSEDRVKGYRNFLNKLWN